MSGLDAQGVGGLTEKLELVVADRDAEYVKLFADYVRESEWSRRLAVRQITRPETLREHLRSRPAQLALIHAELDDGERGGGCRIRLCETKREADEPLNGAAGIYKYQPLPQLLGRMMELYRSDAASGKSAAAPGTPSVCAVYSAAGGVGKTTVAVHLARAFAESGYRCLYWNLELVPGASFPNGPDPALAARFVYGLRANAAWTGECLAGLIARSGPSGFDCFPGFRNVRETLEMTRDDVAKLVALLKQAGKYDMIVLDLEATLHERIWGALAASDSIVWIVTEDGESAVRTFRLLAEWEDSQGGGPLADLRGVRFVMNKHAGFAGSQCSAPGDVSPSRVLPLAAKLPYITGWKQAHGAVRPRAEPLFAEGVAKLASELRSSKGGGDVVGRTDYPLAARTHP